MYAKRKVEEYDSKTVHALASPSSESLVGKRDKSRTNSPVSRRSDPEGGRHVDVFHQEVLGLTSKKDLVLGRDTTGHKSELRCPTC